LPGHPLFPSPPLFRSLAEAGGWRRAADGGVERALPEPAAELARDSRWPALFPSPICLVTAAHGTTAVLERVVGPSIVNRFPYVLDRKSTRLNSSHRTI